MAPNDGWYLVGPLLAVCLVTLVAAVLRHAVERDSEQLCELCTDGLAILCGQATDEPTADEPAPGEPAPGEPALSDLGPGDEDEAGFRGTEEGADFGLLRAAAFTDDPALAVEIRRLLVDAGIRATHAVQPSRQLVVLVFDEQVEEARRLVGDSPVL